MSIDFNNVYILYLFEENMAAFEQTTKLPECEMFSLMKEKKKSLAVFTIFSLALRLILSQSFLLGNFYGW